MGQLARNNLSAQIKNNAIKVPTKGNKEIQSNKIVFKFLRK